MSIADTPYFAVLRERLGFLGQRQKVLADNVANASTPKFVPKDMDDAAFNANISRIMPQASNGIAGSSPIAPVTLAATNRMHISGGNSGSLGSSNRAIRAPDSETTLDGNAVVLEEQMIKVADTRMNYDIALGLYQKGIQLMRLAARRPN